jgi:phospholipid/cholesterol/gamma-HCH transport system permease protein
MMEIVGSEIRFEGTLDRSAVGRLYEDFRRRRPVGLRAIDLDRVDRVDSAGVAFLEYVRRSQSPPAECRNANESVAGMLDLLSAEPVVHAPVVRDSWLARLGGRLLDTASEASSFLTLSASITFWSLMAPFDRHARKRGSIADQCRHIGSSAVPIVGFLALIIGVIVVLQAVLQLRQFGADIFVVDLLALSVTREMGPLITAILVAGRSGSAIAAQIATMKVTEELDALTVMALDPVRYVMVPMLIGMVISIPLLTGLSILVGIGGGMLVAGLALGLAVETFMSRLADVLGPIDLFIGIGKSFFFGAAIVFTGCHFGLGSTGGSEGVGRATTKSVVVSIFAVIALDAIFSLFYLI